MSNLNNNAALNEMVTLLGGGTSFAGLTDGQLRDSPVRMSPAFDTTVSFDATGYVQNNGTDLTIDFSQLPLEQIQGFNTVDLYFQMDSRDYSNAVKLYLSGVSPDVAEKFDIILNQEETNSEVIREVHLTFKIQNYSGVYRLFDWNGQLQVNKLWKCLLTKGDNPINSLNRLDRIKNDYSYRQEFEYDAADVLVFISHISLFDRLGEQFIYDTNPNSGNIVKVRSKYREL